MSNSNISQKRRSLLLGAAGGLAGVATGMLPAASVLAQTYPSRPVTFLCPWPTGGTADATMRVLAKEMAKHLGQPVVFENRPGAAGMIGSRALASATPDGYTIGQIPISVARFFQLGTINFDPLKDFTYLGRTSGQTFGIVVHPESKYKTLADLVNDAKANPGRINYATSGVAGATHVGMEEFLMAAGIKMNHIPYKGGAPALTDLLGGHVDVLADSSSWAPHVETGKLNLLATWGEQRPSRFTNAPTLKEAGYNVVVDAPNGVGAPAGLPPEIEAKLRDALRKAVVSPEFKQAVEKIDAPVMYLDGPDYRTYVLDQYVREKRLIEKLRLKDQIKSS
jgi:tripartite-type tricarboxylate transporter receptor subunit TctC